MVVATAVVACLLSASLASAESLVLKITWTETTSDDNPGQRVGCAFVYDPVIEKYIMYGGASMGGSSLEDTWTYDSLTDTWQNLSVAGAGPSAWPAYAYDYTFHELILFGVGYFAETTPETWAYNASENSWTNLHSATPPPPRTEGAAAYDSRHGRMVMFGGINITYSPDLETVSLNDTWCFDRLNNTWTNLNPPNPPPARDSHRMVYDVQSDKFVMFGGFLGWDVASLFEDGVLGDTWQYDLDANTWTNVTSDHHPSARIRPCVVYEPIIDRTVLFGGNSAYGGSNEAWMYDTEMNNWTEVEQVNAPDPRYGHAMALDAITGRGVVFGGVILNPGISFGNDTWEWNQDVTPIPEFGILPISVVVGIVTIACALATRIHFR